MKDDTRCADVAGEGDQRKVQCSGRESACGGGEKTRR